MPSSPTSPSADTTHAEVSSDRPSSAAASPPGGAGVVRRPMTGWGRYPVAASRVARPESMSTLRSLVTGGDGDGQAAPLLARGAGRSYGDAALNSAGTTLLTRRLDRLLAFDPVRGRLRCEAGVLLKDLLATFVPRGWFLPVTPGTKYVTLGGALAFDVHGKNHHVDGALSHFVREMRLLTASGETVRCAPDERPDLFWATVSGAGLTGVITEVVLDLRPIPSAYVAQRSLKARHLDEAIALFDVHEANYPYSVAWIDCLASGDALGRSLLLFGDHAPPEALADARRAEPLAYASPRRVPFPFELPSGVLNRWTVRAFNALYYARQRARDVRTVVPLESFFYPLDAIRRWNRMYGPDGFTQYQCVLPMDTGRAALVALLERLSRAGRASFLAVLKRMGPEDDGLLSFPMRGYTLALDIPRRPGVAAFLGELDAIVLRHGGRVYLAKDAYLSPETFRAMYPRYPAWRAIKDDVDPHGVFTSDLARRLKL